MASEEEEGEGLASPENANLRSHFVISGSGGCNDFYNIGIFDAGEDSKSVAIIGIIDIDGSILVALPEFGWAQKKAERVLPKGALSKVRAVRVTSCRIGDRTAASDVPSLKIWLGLLDPSFEEFVKVDPFEAPSVDFPGEDQEQCIPFGPALVAVCQDHFVFQSAESQGAVGTEPIVQMEQRLKAMEEMIVGLTRQLAPGQSYVGPTPKKKAARAAERGKGLDDAVVQQALQSGVAPHVLQEMSKIVGPPGLPSRAAPAGFQHAVGSSEEEEEKEPGEEEQGDAVATGSADPVQQAVVQLTKLVTHLGAEQVRSVGSPPLTAPRAALGRALYASFERGLGLPGEEAEAHPDQEGGGSRATQTKREREKWQGRSSTSSWGGSFSASAEAVEVYAETFSQIQDHFFWIRPLLSKQRTFFVRRDSPNHLAYALALPRPAAGDFW